MSPLSSVGLAPFRLIPHALLGLATGSPREGALLRLGWADGVRGFASVAPWPELGDPPLPALLGALAEDPERAAARASLLGRALASGRLDGEARAEGRWLFEGLELPESHALLAGPPHAEALRGLAEEGFSAVKIKVGGAPSPRAEGRAVGRALLGEPRLRLRLDANGRLDREGLRALLEGLREGLEDPALSRLELFEDPLPGLPSGWIEGGPLPFCAACDRELEPALGEAEGRSAPPAFAVAVIKPALGDPEALARRALARGVRALVVTSYLGHPLELLASAHQASLLRAAGLPLLACGLASHRAYEEDPFSAPLRMEGARLLPPPGPGLGLCAPLSGIPFEPLFGPSARVVGGLP